MKACAALIGLPEADLLRMEAMLDRLGGVTISRLFSGYPEPDELGRFLRAAEPDLLFVSTSVPAEMERTVTQATQAWANVQIVLVDSELTSTTLKRAMQMGVRECLTIPFSSGNLRGVIERSMARRGRASINGVGANCMYSFFPVCGGSGASILAAQTALSLPGDATHRSLLIDADLDAGMLHFLLKVQCPYSLIEALEQVDQLDGRLWPQLVATRGNLDVMQTSDFGGDYHPDLRRLQSLLAFARTQYSAILVDLPASFNRLTTEIMQQSKAVFLVTTPELASLQMARRRWRTLQDLQLGHHVRLLVSRVDKKQKGAISMEQIPSTVGLPIHAVFANDYEEVQQAIITGDRLPLSRPLGRQIAALAEALPQDSAAVEPPKRHRFLEVFALTR